MLRMGIAGGAVEDDIEDDEVEAIWFVLVMMLLVDASVFGVLESCGPPKGRHNSSSQE